MAKPEVSTIDIVPPPIGLERHAKQHELWLAMQIAHERYRTASLALELSAANEQCESNEPSSDASAVMEQRTAFEQYVEARLQFSEFMLDQRPAEPSALARPSEVSSSLAGYLGMGRRRLTLLAGAFIVTSAMICSAAYLVHERRMVHAFEQQSRQMDTLLDQTTRDIETLGQRLDVISSRTELTRRIVQRSRSAASRKPAVRLVPPSNGRRRVVSTQRRGGRIGPFRSQLKPQTGLRFERLPKDMTASSRNGKHPASS